MFYPLLRCLDTTASFVSLVDNKIIGTVNLFSLRLILRTLQSLLWHSGEKLDFFDLLVNIGLKTASDET